MSPAYNPGALLLYFKDTKEALFQSLLVIVDISLQASLLPEDLPKLELLTDRRLKLLLELALPFKKLAT